MFLGENYLWVTQVISGFISKNCALGLIGSDCDCVLGLIGSDCDCVLGLIGSDCDCVLGLIGSDSDFMQNQVTFTNNKLENICYSHGVVFFVLVYANVCLICGISYNYWYFFINIGFD